MIGVIVGVVLAVILLIVAIALLVFAKASNRWCFAEDDYKNPNDARAHPNSRSGGGGMRRPANQVYRFILHLEQLFRTKLTNFNLNCLILHVSYYFDFGFNTFSLVFLELF